MPFSPATTTHARSPSSSCATSWGFRVARATSADRGDCCATPQLVARVEGSTLIASATASFRRDDINTYIYARFLNVTRTLDSGTPLANARVEVLDQDTPAPPGDDVDVPESSDIERITDRFIASVTVTVEPPTSDAVLARGTTNFDGRVMIMLTPGQAANPAGHVVTTISTENLRTGDIETRPTRSPVTESAPDIYFRVFALGDDDDTKSKPRGVTVNLRSKHLGTPTQPVQFRVRISPGTVLGR